jgi:hypothetical protein
LLTITVRPLRRTTIDPSRRFNDFSEFLTFMAAPSFKLPNGHLRPRIPPPVDLVSERPLTYIVAL